MTNPNTLTAEKIAELIESAPPEGQPCECTWEVYCDICFVIKNNLRYFLSSAEQVAALQQRVGELEAELKAEQARAFHLAAITCDTPAGDEGGHKYCTRIRDLEAALAEARKMPEWIKEELDLKRRMVDACKNLSSPDTCIDCLRDQKFIQAAMQHCATPAKEKP